VRLEGALVRVFGIAMIGLLCGGIVPSAIAGPFIARELEPNDSVATATPIATNPAIVEGNIVPGTDIDLYSFTATAGDRVFIATATSPATDTGDTIIDLLAPDGVTVLETDDNNGQFDNTASSIAGALLSSAGTYYIKVRKSASGSVIAPYRLYFQRRATASETAESEPNDSSPMSLPASGYISGSTSSVTDVDLYSVFLNAGDTIFLSLDTEPARNGVEWNGVLAFGPSALRMVSGGDDPGSSGPDSEAFMTTVKTAGTYRIQVGASASGGAYLLSASLFPANDQGINCSSYAGPGFLMPPSSSGNSSTIVVPGHPRIADLQLTIDINHPEMFNVDAKLLSPRGNIMLLFAKGQLSGPTGLDATIDDRAALSLGSLPDLDGYAFAPAKSRLSWLEGEDAGGTWTLELTNFSTTAPGNFIGWELRICEPSPLPQCSAGFFPTILFSSDFEANDGGFTHSGVTDEWARGLPNTDPVGICSSGTKCWKTHLNEFYDPNSVQDLLSPVINLNGVSPPVIVEWQQNYQMGSVANDHFFVEAREHNNAPFNMRLFEHLAPAMSAPQIRESSGWSLEHRIIDPFIGHAIEVRFHLDSGPAAPSFAGVAIDDVKVTACKRPKLAIPTGLTATTQPDSTVQLTWNPSPNAEAYDIERRSSDSPVWAPLITGVVGTTYNDGDVVGNRAYIYRITATSSAADPSNVSRADAASTFVFADDPVIAGVLVQGAHIVQLRNATDAFRIATGLVAFDYTDASVDGTVAVSTVHIDDLRSAEVEGREKIGMDPPVYPTDPTLTPASTKIKAAHINELRNALR